MAKRKIKVIGIGKYLEKLGDGPERYAEALKTIYSEEKVIASHVIHSNLLFVCEG